MVYTCNDLQKYNWIFDSSIHRYDIWTIDAHALCVYWIKYVCLNKLTHSQTKVNPMTVISPKFHEQLRAGYFLELSPLMTKTW